MKANGLHIDLATNTLHFRDHRPNTCIMQTSARLARNMKTVYIPPQHGCNIGIKISKRNSGDIVYLEAVKDIQSLNLIIAKCLVKMRRSVEFYILQVSQSQFLQVRY